MQSIESNTAMSEKIELGTERPSTPDRNLKTEMLEDDGEVFKSHTGQAEFRALGWCVAN